MNNSIQDETAVDHGYGEGAPNGTSGTSRNGSSIRVSQLPKHIRSSAMKLDLDGDGALNEKDIAQAVGHLDNKEKENKNLQRIIVAFGILSVLLIAAIFGARAISARHARAQVLQATWIAVETAQPSACSRPCSGSRRRSRT